MIIRPLLILLACQLIAQFFGMSAYAFDAAGTYQAQCISCHGAQGAGDGPVGKLLSPPVAPLSVTCDPQVILNGRGRMPGFASKLQPADAEALCGHIKSLRSQAP